MNTPLYRHVTTLPPPTYTHLQSLPRTSAHNDSPFLMTYNCILITCIVSNNVHTGSANSKLNVCWKSLIWGMFNRNQKCQHLNNHNQNALSFSMFNCVNYNTDQARTFHANSLRNLHVWVSIKLLPGFLGSNCHSALCTI